MDRRAQRSPIAEPAPAAHVVVYVAGEVRRPGVYTFSAANRAGDAVSRAGGALADADLVAVNLAAPLIDGEEIAVPKSGAENRTSRGRVAHQAPSPRARRRGRRSRPGKFLVLGASAARIDLNTADTGALEAIPGVGPALAERIVAYRELNGPFASTDELADVSGVTARLQETLEAFVFAR